ncbi:unnamed protein product, partial [Mesorhabditis belari]|uniref:Tetratricopeptide repeat protein 17 n=1 Tax=Mesorhabditis belari TaxID=2138241 RepID=A0AAF3JBY1_9BILA
MKPVPYSPFMMARPQHLIEFVNQVKLVEEWTAAVTELNEKMERIQMGERIDDPDLEQKLRENNPHCQKGKEIPLKMQSFLTNYAVEQTKEYVAQAKLEIMNDAMLQRKVPPTQELPYCKAEKISILYDYLDAMPGFKNFDELIIDHAPELVSICAPLWEGISLLPGETRVDAMGRYLVALLTDVDTKISQSPYVYLSAACYWRIVGEASEAYQCARAALQAAANFKSELEPYAVLTLGNLMLMAKRDEEAVILLDLAAHDAQAMGADHHSLSTIAFGVLGDAYAISANLSMAVKSYGKALEKAQTAQLQNIDPEIWAKKQGTLICTQTIQDELQHQESNIRSIIDNKHAYNDLVEKVDRLEKEVRKHVTSDEKLLQHYLRYDQAKFGVSKLRKCTTRVIGKRKLEEIHCRITDPSTYDSTFSELRNGKTNQKHKKKNVTEWKTAEVWRRERSFDKNLAPFVGMEIDEAPMSKKYPLEKSTLTKLSMDRYWRRADWPNTYDCTKGMIAEEDLFHKNSIRPYFISPDNKGFIVADLLTKYLGLEISEEHPLPWDEPKCGDYQFHEGLMLRDFKVLIEAWNEPIVYAEPELRSIFVRLADKRLELMDVAQRIRTLIEKKIGPKWIALNLAALYYRVIGKPQEAARCVLVAAMEGPKFADVAFSQLAQIVVRVTGSAEASIDIMKIAADFGADEPLYHYLLGRFNVIAYRVDEGIASLKEALDRDPSFTAARDDLLQLVCKGKTSTVGVRDLFPNVCCSSLIQNAVCIRPPKSPERCYEVDEESRKLVYVRCNGVYTGVSYKTHPIVSLVSPFLTVFPKGSRRDIIRYHVDVGRVHTVEHEELPLDYGGPSSFFVKHDEWWKRATPKIQWKKPEAEEKVNWVETVEYQQPEIPPRPLSFLWIKDKKEMLRYDIKLPEVLPRPLASQVRAGLQVFPPPRTATQMCSGVTKLSTLIEAPVPTWVSVTAKGEDLEKYIDIRTPVPSVANLVPECPTPKKEKYSPILSLDHLPIGPLADQFLFYKPEKGLTEALKSLGNDRESIDHVAAKLHHAIKFSQATSEMNGEGGDVHWLLTLVSSLYWRVVGDAPKAIACLRHSLQNAPPHMRDVALVALSNVCHQAGLLHSALVTAGMAFEQSPQLAAIHVTIANIYASIGDYEKALEFYYSTLSLQNNFEPAKARIRAIYCHSGQTFNFQN